MKENGFSNHHFIIVNNTRLQFEDSVSPVSLFIERRLMYHSVGAYEFVENWVSATTYIETLFKELTHPANYIVIADIMNPLFDMDLVFEMSEMLERTKAPYCKSEGAIPGTEIIGVLSVGNMVSGRRGSSLEFAVSDIKAVTCRWHSQQKYNNQFNLYKYKRLKLFLTLIKTIDTLHEKSIDEVLEAISSDEIYSMLVSFGEKVRLQRYEKCPHCASKLNPLLNSMSQPFCGYLPSDRPLYHECESCGLVVQSPSVHEDDVHTIYDRWDKQDFVASTNNPYTDEAVRCDLSKLLPMLPAKTKSLDLGGGIGNFSKYLLSRYPEWEITHSDFEIKANISGRILSRVIDFTKEPIGDAQYNLITAWEVIEHVTFHKLSFVLRNVWQALAPGGLFVFSTPNFDSPICKSFDFYALCPPFHYVVFGEKWLRRYFADSDEFEIVDVKHCCDFLDDATNWYSYGKLTCPSLALQNTSALLQAIFEADSDHVIRSKLVKAGMGTEIVITLKKRDRVQPKLI